VSHPQAPAHALEATHAPPEPLFVAGSKLALVQLPSVLSIERGAFDAATFAADAAQHANAHGTPSQNIVRWRMAQHPHPQTGEPTSVPESNARLVRWPDGSLQLWIGRQPQEVSEHPLPGPEHHLYTQIAADAHLCAGAFGSRLVVKPSEQATAQKRLESKLHAIRAIDAVKVKRAVRVVSAEDAAAGARAQAKAEREADALDRKRAQTRARALGLSGAGFGGGGRKSGGKLSSNFLEAGQDEDEDEVHARTYGEDDDDDDEENEDDDEGAGQGGKRGNAARRLSRAKQMEEDEEDDEEEDEDEDEGPRGHPSLRRVTSTGGDDEVDEDEDEDEEEDGDFEGGDEEDDEDEGSDDELDEDADADEDEDDDDEEDASSKKKSKKRKSESSDSDKKKARKEKKLRKREKEAKKKSKSGKRLKKSSSDE
jgi:hypothetical protein